MILKWTFLFAVVSVLIIMLLIIYRMELCSPNFNPPRITSNSINNTSLANSHDRSSHWRKSIQKIAFMTASYKLTQYLTLWKTLESIRDICNAGFDVSIFIQAAAGIEPNSTLFHRLQDTLYCARLRRNIDFFIQTFPDIGFGLNSKHRGIMRDVLDTYDLFVYAEEDMLITSNHVINYLDELDSLKQDLPTSWKNYFPGFLRLLRMQHLKVHMNGLSSLLLQI